MSKRIIAIVILVLIFCLFFSYFLLKHSYLQALKRNLTIKYYLPSSEVLPSDFYGKITFSFKYPVIKSYFLENFKISPDIDGEFVFKEEVLNLPFNTVAYKKVEFLPKDIERDKIYQIEIFDKEFNFSLPSPKVQKMDFNFQRKEIEIVFFGSVDENYFFKNFKTEPSLQGKYYFLESGRKIIFRPYLIEEDKDHKVEILDKNISFVVESPKVKEFIFNENEKQIEITFTIPIERERFFKNFSISPELEGEWIFDDTGTKFIFKIKDIPEDVDYHVKILDKDYYFKIEPVKVKRIYFDNSRKQVVIIFTKPIENAKFFESFQINPSLDGKFTFNPSRTQVIFKPNEIKEEELYEVIILDSKLSFKYTPPPPPPPPPPARTGDKYIDINLSTQRLRLYQDGVVIAEYLISSGKRGMETPTGTFRVLSKTRLHWSTQYRLYMPYAIRFYNGYYIHELPYWPGGYREGEHHLGIPVSHGCVRLGIGAAEVVYNFADIGTKIIIHY